MGSREAAQASSIHTTGVCRRSAPARTWLIAPDWMMPCPARIKGHFAVEDGLGSIRNALLGHIEHRWIPTFPGAAAAKSNCAITFSASFVMSDERGPWPARFCNPRNIIAQHRRYIFGPSCDDIVVLGRRERDAGDVHFLERVGARTLLPTCPVMRPGGIESSIAVAMPVTM